MFLPRGVQLATYLLGAPGAVGTAAHLLTSKYLNLMNFEGNYFLVKAVSELYDSGIPQIPESIRTAVDQIVKQLQTRRKTRRDVSAQQASVSQAQHEEVFKDKKYWCRYFDYSKGAQNVIMEYDKDCILYNIFDIKGKNNSQAVAVQAAQAQADENNTASGGKVYDISAINSKENNINALKLSSNNDFLKGAFYLLSLDKTKFSRLNTLTHIELTEVGNERLSEQTYQKKIATLKIKAPMKGDIKDLQLSFLDNKLPSSVLLLKKVKANESKQIQTASSGGDSGVGGGGGGSPDNSSKTYFLQKKNESSAGQTVSQSVHKSDDKNPKLQVLGMWEFPPIQKDKDKLSELDLRYLDKVLWDKISEDSTKTPFVRLGLFGHLLSALFKNGQDIEKKYENYYVTKTLSDFWNYKIGDKVQLIETTETKATAQAQASLQLVASEPSVQTSTTDKNLAEFEVVSGLLVHLNSPVQCIPNSSTITGEFINLPFKRNFAKKTNGVFTEKKHPSYCKPADNGMPPYTMIFLGNSIDKLDKNVKSVSA